MFSAGVSFSTANEFRPKFLDTKTLIIKFIFLHCSETRDSLEKLLSEVDFMPSLTPRRKSTSRLPHFYVNRWLDLFYIWQKRYLHRHFGIRRKSAYRNADLIIFTTFNFNLLFYYHISHFCPSKAKEKLLFPLFETN